jgi:glyceraldehyde 3-phosphate dehydrogenase
MKIAVNGFGRMGRLFTRIALAEGLDIAAINEPAGDADAMALALEFDSAQGRYARPVRAEANRLVVGDHGLHVVQRAELDELPWRELDIGLVVECSGKAKQKQRCERHLLRGATAVLASHPVPDVPNVVYGVNHDTVDFAAEPVVTAASCTTNCLAPIVRVLHDAIGIERGLVTTVHDPTNSQSVVDRVTSSP